MNLLTLDSISKQYSERLLFDGATMQINEGERIGLIGVNGSGKSTLLRIAAGFEAPDAGRLIAVSGVRIEYVAQEPPLDDRLTVLETLFTSEAPQIQLLRRYEEANDALQHDPHDERWQTRLHELSAEMERSAGWAAEANAKAVLTRLGISAYSAKIATLSGGQRKRVALARALIDRADLLILDEPTNHIDADTVAWLEEYLVNERNALSLNGRRSALLMVTHDRYFLDRVVNRIVELDRRQLVAYPGNYARYLEQRSGRQERLAANEEKRRNLLRRELEWLRRGAQARSTKQKARKERVQELMQIRYDRGEERVSIALASRRLGSKALIGRNLGKRYGAHTVLSQVNLTLEPGERIGIIGPNGAGKSTLLDILAGRLAPDAGSLELGDTVRIGYYDQRSAALDEQMRLLEFIERSAAVITTSQGERVDAALMLEWFLFPRSMQSARIGSLSGGERRRLYLLYTLVHQPNVLLLDEPTNDLDIQTLTVLEEFLDHFQGCLVVASHDRYFLDRTVDFLLSLENGVLGPRYPAPFTTYEALRQQAQAVLETTQETMKTPAKGAAPALSSPGKRSWKVQRELAEIEARLAELEHQKTTLQQAINDSGGDYLQLQSLSEQLESVLHQIAAEEERWLEIGG